MINAKWLKGYDEHYVRNHWKKKYAMMKTRWEKDKYWMLKCLMIFLLIYFIYFMVTTNKTRKQWQNVISLYATEAAIRLSLSLSVALVLTAKTVLEKWILCLNEAGKFFKIDRKLCFVFPATIGKQWIHYINHVHCTFTTV